MTKNFSVCDDGVALTATATSAVYAFTRNLRGPDVMIDNPTAYSLYVRSGNASTTATLQSMRVPPGTMQPFDVGDASHLAYRTEAGQTAAFVLHRGSGQ